MQKSRKKERSKPIADPKKTKSFQIVESYKILRTNLLFSLATAEHKVVVVSSAEPHAGKSTTSANLSVVMAQTGSKILLIDADMRNPSVDRVFRISRKEGLSKILSGMSTADEAILKDVAPHLDVIPAGPIPPNPQELLCSDNMYRLIEQMEERYDYIFIDTPPVNVVADALLPMRHAAGMLLVVRERLTTREDVSALIDSVRQIDGHILGAVLTDMTPRKGSRGDRYYKSEKYAYVE